MPIQIQKDNNNRTIAIRFASGVETAKTNLQTGITALDATTFDPRTAAAKTAILRETSELSLKTLLNVIRVLEWIVAAVKASAK
jgi:hypothetical protein